MRPPNPSIKTDLGWVREYNRNGRSGAFALQNLLSPRDALRLVGLDLNRDIDRSIWTYFCSHRVTVEGIGSNDDGGSLWLEARGAHRIDKHGQILGYAARQAGAPPLGMRWGYNPLSVAELLRTYDVQGLGWSPNLADNLGLSVWLVGTDRILAINENANKPKKDLRHIKLPSRVSCKTPVGSLKKHFVARARVKPSGPYRRTLHFTANSVSPTWLDWPGNTPAKITGLLEILLSQGIFRELAPWFTFTSGKMTIEVSPVIETDDDPFTPEPEIEGYSEDDWLNLTDEKREELLQASAGLIASDLERFFNTRENLLRAFSHRPFRVQRNTQKRVLLKHCTYCGVLFETDDGRRRACDEHCAGSGDRPRPEYEAARKRKQRQRP